MSVNVATTGEYRCVINLPVGAFSGGSGGSQTNGSDGATLDLTRYRYDDAGAGYSMGIYDTHCDVEGGDPDAVYASAADCAKQVAQAQYGSADLVQAAEDPLGGGLVFASPDDFVQSASGDYWWHGTLTGVKSSEEFRPALKEFAGLLPPS
jgi:hypothetical protein